MAGKIKINIDYSICGDGSRIDPRKCGKCLRACDPAIFLLHQSFNTVEEDPYDPQIWRITPMWPTLCSKCMKCVNICPEGAIQIDF